MVTLRRRVTWRRFLKDKALLLIPLAVIIGVLLGFVIGKL